MRFFLLVQESISVFRISSSLRNTAFLIILQLHPCKQGDRCCCDHQQWENSFYMARQTQSCACVTPTAAHVAGDSRHYQGEQARAGKKSGRREILPAALKQSSLQAALCWARVRKQGVMIRVNPCSNFCFLSPQLSREAGWKTRLSCSWEQTRNTSGELSHSMEWQQELFLFQNNHVCNTDCYKQHPLPFSWSKKLLCRQGG